MRSLAWFLVLAACKTGSTVHTGTPGGDVATHAPGQLADDDFKPSYDKAELQRALAAERPAVAAAEQRLQALEDGGDYDQQRNAAADLAVRKRFVAALEACDANGRVCPPRLDEPVWTYDVEADTDPKLDAPLRFDVDSWRKLSAELHGRACACRTLACTDSMFAAIDRLEKRPMPDVQGDDDASLSITRARECLYRLRGLRPTPRAIPTE
jgi:hypothetical protein